MDEKESGTRNRKPNVNISSSTGRLPPELVDKIIDELYDDEETLSTCALVCKSWVPASRYNHSLYFPEFTLSPWSDSESLIMSPSCTIANEIQHLVLEKMGGSDYIHNIVSRLPNITHLTLFKSDMGVISNVAFIKDLESLVLSCVRVDNPDMFFDILRHCTQLQSLSCYDVSFSERPISQPHPNNQDTTLLGLKALRVHGSYRVLENIVGHWDKAIPQLTTLDLDIMGAERIVERILDAAGSSLQEFRLGEPDPKIAFAERNFPSLIQLRSLAVRFYWYSSDKFGQYLVPALRHLTSPRLQELSIFIHTHPPEVPNLDGWSELRPYLESGRFQSTLLKLNFRFDILASQEVVDECRRILTEMFPHCAERGILCVDSGFWE